MVQFAGAIGAALFLQLMFGDVAAGGNYPIATPGGEWKSLVMETVLTAILVTVILNTATGAAASATTPRIAVGSTVALLGLFASPISGASMNPARSLGPDIVSTDFTGWWVYVARAGDRRRHRRHDHRARPRDCPTRRSARPPRAAPCRCSQPDGAG